MTASRPALRPAPRQRIGIPAAFMGERGMFLVREPADTDLDAVIASLRECTYPRPFVYDDGVVRRLHFSTLYTQSEMIIRAPNALTLAYTRTMMGFLLFAPTPEHVVVVGLGGGSLTKYCHHHLPRTRITSIEIDAEVLAFADLFELPPPGPRHAIIEGDAVDYFSRTRDRPDVILLDGCDRDGIAPAFRDACFHDQLRASLAPGGVLVMNLVGPAAERRANLRLIARSFHANLLVLAVADGNQVVFAFKDPAFPPPWHEVEERARRLTRRHDLDLSRIARTLQRAYHRGMGADE